MWSISRKRRKKETRRKKRKKGVAKRRRKKEARKLKYKKRQKTVRRESTPTRCVSGGSPTGPVGCTVFTDAEDTVAAGLGACSIRAQDGDVLVEAASKEQLAAPGLGYFEYRIFVQAVLRRMKGKEAI